MNEQDEKALAVLDAVADVVTGRVKRYNDKVNKEIIAGKTPHPETLLKQDRAIDLADHYTAARAHLSSVVAERDALKVVLSRVASSREGLMLLGRIAGDEMDKLDRLFDMAAPKENDRGHEG
jgi:hypothetical protein